MDFPEIIRAARTSSGLSQSDLAAKAGLGIATLWRLENDGDRAVDMLDRLCRALDLRFAGLPRKGLRLKGQDVAGPASVEPAMADGTSGLLGWLNYPLENGNARVKALSKAFAVLAPAVRVRKPEVVA
jgi:transcriptional regulator with XRE-family HTH domain